MYLRKMRQGVVGQTTAALFKDREGRREALRQRLHAVANGPAMTSGHVGPAEIRAPLERLDELLRQDPARANSVFRQTLEPITMMPVEENGQRFYRATGAAKGTEMLDRLGLAQAVDFGGCGGWI